jgi:alpha-tubulin suppressor-like RCC1 family protein
MSRTPTPARALAAAIVLVLAALGITTGTGSAAAAVPESGSVLAFGSNVWGQLGNATNIGTTNPNAAPASLTVPIGAGSVVQVAAGTGHTLLVSSSGQLLALGTNAAGQLGIGPASATPMPVPTPVTLPGAIGSVTQTAAGAGFSLALTSSGQLYAFGSNQFSETRPTTAPPLRIRRRRS